MGSEADFEAVRAAERGRAGRDPETPEAFSDPSIRRARDLIREQDPVTLRDQIRITEIAAPPFGERARARYIAERLTAAGLIDTHIDGEGNVVARTDDRSGPPMIISAHLDTVFPEGTDVRVHRREGRLVGPGISDDGRGLAALLSLARAIREAEVRFRRPLTFVATVGEEGAGDLRGVRHLFRDDGPFRHAAGFISLDGAGLNRIVTTGLGSRRFRITVRGPGGHSWVDWGTPNPIHALGRAVDRLSRFDLSEDPPAALSVTRWGGGTSVNAIPEESWIELDLRCVSERVLERHAEGVARLVRQALEGLPEGSAGLDLEIEPIGRRPGGLTEPDHPLVRAAVEATTALGGAPELSASSTDANYPMSIGVPALTMGAGGEAGAAHTAQEWYRNRAGPQGILRALLTLVLFDRAGV